MSSAATSPRLDVDEIRERARGNWRPILARLGIDVPTKANQHGPCPACGGKDRFRFDDQDGRGTWFCNQCNPQAGDGLALVQNAFSCDFHHALESVASETGYRPLNGPHDRQSTDFCDDQAPRLPKGELGHDLFVYENAEGVPVICVQRINLPDGEKTFRQWGRTADGAGWQRNLDHVPKPRHPYRLQAILASVQRMIVNHEGEKACEAAVRAGLPGVHTTTLGGAKNPKHTDFSSLNGREVVICRDNDEPGEAYAAEVARLCHEAGAKSVKVLLLPGLPPKGDVVEWLQAGGTPEAFAALVEQVEPVKMASSESSVDAAWADPLPLIATIATEPYPADALPDEIRQAVEEVRTFTKAPVPLVASSALATLSLAGQAHIDVKRADRLTGPTSLFFLSLADSGERKSTTDGMFSNPIRAYDLAQAEKARPALKDYAAKYAGWSAECEGVLQAIKQAAKNGEPTVDLKNKLAGLEQDNPPAPRVPQLLHGDDTPEHLAYTLAHKYPSAGILTAEAGLVFGSHGMGTDSIMRNLALFNTLWDGGAHQIGRRTSESYTVRGARLTMGLQVQAPTLRSFYERSGALARGTGFFARFLLAWPESTQGYRLFSDPPDVWPALEGFHRQITEILNTEVKIDGDGALTPTLMSLSAAAKTTWVSFHDGIEEKLRTGGELYDVRDVASKTADNAARLAALFALFSSKNSNSSSSNVSVEHMERACRIVAWHLNESRRFFGELAIPTELADAAQLDAWLIRYCLQEEVSQVKLYIVQQSGPGKLRNKATLLRTVRELEKLARIRLVEGKLIMVNPALLTKNEEVS